MENIKRTLLPVLEQHDPHQVLAIYGPHFCGKSSLVRDVMQKHSACVLIDCDDSQDVMYLLTINEESALEFLQDKSALFIKNAHKVPNIRTILKYLAKANKAFEQQRMIVLTSAIDLKLNLETDNLLSFNIERLVNIDEESLLFKELKLWPFTLHELLANIDNDSILSTIDDCLIKGFMPQILDLEDNSIQSSLEKLLMETKDKKELLLHDVHLLSPHLSVNKFNELLTILAHKLGCELNFDELELTLGMSRSLIEEYLALLERCLAIKICKSIHLSIKGELCDGVKVYFTDIALRNALLQDFSPIEERNEQEIQALFENLFFMERFKKHSLEQNPISIYFWRMSAGATKNLKANKIDFVELGQGMRAYQCGYNQEACKHFDKDNVFAKTYYKCSLNRVTMENLLSYIA